MFVTNGCTPADMGVVYYEFRELEDSRETVSDVVPATAPATAEDRRTSYSQNLTPDWGTVILLGVALFAAALSPIPGDEIAAGAALLATIG